ncbi:hypothetical protein OUY22_27510 [Nonomuraea sp. MCN248]|uniref:WXG100 family type VII secretion target n=1 Tax=Nonomuraea corallina TaxID=2989783 RepID=A0ABT4SJR6_9ACTN|nr:hypothetical protein [Nonomuraea corallina]MDA0637166.1 hypothetical protein [Nonomuraea corallina]
MSIYKETYMGAAIMATLAAPMIMRPWAFYVAAALGTMISDPEGMMESAKEWKVNDLVQLDGEIETLKTTLKDKGTWEGEAFEAFDKVHTSFKESLKNLNESRNATGEAVDSTAGFYKVGAFVCSAIAVGMMAYGIWKMVARSNPATAVAAEATDAAVGTPVTNTVKSMLKKHGIAVASLAGLLGMVKMQTESAGKVFPTLKAIPTEMSLMQSGGSKPFMNDGMTYDDNVGTLLPKMDESLTRPGGGLPL